MGIGLITKAVSTASYLSEQAASPKIGAFILPICCFGSNHLPRSPTGNKKTHNFVYRTDLTVTLYCVRVCVRESVYIQSGLFYKQNMSQFTNFLRNCESAEMNGIKQSIIKLSPIDFNETTSVSILASKFGPNSM